MASEKALKQPLLEKANGKWDDDEQEVKKGELPKLILCSWIQWPLLDHCGPFPGNLVIICGLLGPMPPCIAVPLSTWSVNQAAAAMQQPVRQCQIIPVWNCL